MTPTTSPGTELWTIRGHVWRAEPVVLADGREGFLLVNADDPQWDEVWDLVYPDDDVHIVEG